MSAYLLTWKPSEWAEEKLDEYISEFRSGQNEQRWSCGGTKNIPNGSRFFLMRQGSGLTGLFGSGEVVREPFADDHYNEAKRLEGKKANYVMVRFDRLFDPTSGIKITPDEFKRFHPSLWRSQGSGKSIPLDVAVQIERLWSERCGDYSLPYADELLEGLTYSEGTKKQVTVNAYERDPRARDRCIGRWGHSCSVCGFHFQSFYGELGKGYIHVHHLKPLLEIGEEYKVDPIIDLRPVCPNCHAMLHRGKSVLSIKELKSLIISCGGEGRD
ncbi:HNH endonuclease [Synechococcus sp. RSCCF101]|uniref:HNH endonuclease n=1 Tax=Synechococcus sp. RSCCF101 TaxID=2511069 RepID=UPI001243B711|nr:HNH endonuclease [Synechococcus sp. RSCCF101]QEY33055.1 HNH endonuclease [Synechococcus sp. RSCCF101]